GPFDVRRRGDRWCRILLRPVRIAIRAGTRDLTEILSVAVDQEDLLLPGPRRRERDVAAVWRKRRALVRPDAVGNRPGGAGREIEDLDVVPRTVLGRVGDLVERGRRPGRPVAPRLGADPPETRPVGIDDVNHRVAASIRGEGDLVAR